MALQLHHFPEETFLRRAVEQGHAEGSLWTAYRDGDGSAARRGLLQRLPFLSRFFRGPPVDPARVNLGMDAGRETPTLRTAAQLQTAEGVVALVLSDLYRENLTTPEQVRDIINRSGVTDLDGLVREIKAQHGNSPQAARVEALRSRRFLGADINYEAACALYEARLSGQLSPEAYARQIDGLIAREIQTRTGHRVDLRQAPPLPRIGDGQADFQQRVRDERARQAASPAVAADDAARPRGATPDDPARPARPVEDRHAPRAPGDVDPIARASTGGLAGARASLGFDFRQGGIFVAPVITGAMTLWESMQKGEDFGQALRNTGKVLASPEFLVGNVLAGSAGAALGSAIPLPARLVGPGLLRGMAGATPVMAGAILASKLGMGLVQQLRQGQVNLGALVGGVDWGLTAAEIAGTVIGMSVATALAGPALLAATTLGPFALIPIAGAILGGIAAERLVHWWRNRHQDRPPPARVHGPVNAQVLGVPMGGARSGS